MDDIRVAFAGASGTGKTTLAKWISQTYKIPMNPIGSRTVAKAMGFENPYDVDKAGRRAEFQRSLIAQKRGWEDAHDSFVVDRTTLDNLVYTMLHDVSTIDRELLDDIVEGLQRYTHIVFCPMAVFVHTGKDPSRVDSTVYHELYDATLRSLLQKYTPDTVRLETMLVSGIARRRNSVRQLLGSEQ